MTDVPEVRLHMVAPLPGEDQQAPFTQVSAGRCERMTSYGCRFNHQHVD